MSAGKIKLVQFDHRRQFILTSAQMRATEQDAIKAGATTGLSMMETAAQGVIDALMLADTDFSAGHHKALVLCGPGNNGGDGFAIARILQTLGWAVEVGLYGNIENLPADAATNARRWLETHTIFALEEISQSQIAMADVVFDAIFGTGLTRPLATEILALLDRVANSKATVVAIDIPTGVNSDTGRFCFEKVGNFPPNDGQQQRQTSCWPSVDHIVTFQSLKPGHLLATSLVPEKHAQSSKPHSLSIVDLGIGPFEPARDVQDRICIGGAPFDLHKTNRGHKYEYGHALVFAGGTGRGGAGRLTARAALRMGAGVVTLATPTDAITENAAQLNSIMLTPISTQEELRDTLGDKRKNALCLGPGMGVGQSTKAMVLEALRSKRSIVLDADALTSFAADTAALFQAAHNATVLTPHEGEFARLFPDLAEKLSTPFSNDSRVDVVREAAKRANCHVLLKGPVTVVASPTGRIELAAALAERAAPWLATAGSGDVLAGFITGLMSRGFAPFEAACSAAWLHVECARAFGPGLIAEDLPDMLPRVLSQWENDRTTGNTAL